MTRPGHERTGNARRAGRAPRKHGNARTLAIAGAMAVVAVVAIAAGITTGKGTPRDLPAVAPGAGITGVTAGSTRLPASGTLSPSGSLSFTSNQALVSWFATTGQDGLSWATAFVVSSLDVRSGNGGGILIANTMVG